MPRRSKRQRVTERDLGLREIVARLKEGGGVRATVGIQGSEASADHGGITNAQLFAVHEFGATFMHPGGTAFTFAAAGQIVFVSNERAGSANFRRTAPHMITIPQRSSLRSTFDREVDKYVKFIGEGVRTTGARRGDILRLFALVGELHKADIIRAIDAGISPPNRPSTIARKGSSKPLIDSGQMKGAITVKVEDRG